MRCSALDNKKTMSADRQMYNRLPKTRYSQYQEQLKGEDVIFVHESLEKLHSTPDKLCHWSLYCICDGHGGQDAAIYLKEHLGKVLVHLLPYGSPPMTGTRESKNWLKNVQTGLVEAFLQMDKNFENEGLAASIGSTVTVVLVSGWIMSIANIGDSESYLDVGRRKEFELTTSHKLDTNKEEQERLRNVGKLVAPLSEDLFQPAGADEEGVGPMRVWPCGLAVSRSVGDYDCGCEVTAAPSIRQIEIPLCGARMILASDGLWDHVSGRRAMRESRKLPLDECAESLVRLAEDRSKDGLTDDTSVLVADFMPASGMDWRDACKKLRGPANILKRLRGKIKGEITPEIPKKVGDYDGVVQSMCAILGERATTQILPPRPSSPQHVKYVSDPALTLGQYIQNQTELSDSESGDTDTDERAVEIERSKSKMAAASSYLGLTAEQISAAQATRRTIAPRTPDHST